MKTLLAATALAVALAAGPSVAAVGQADGQKYEKGATITLQGCVVAAEKKDTYVLTNVREWPISNTDMGKFGKRYYWIDKAGNDMKAHLGHTIQVIGKISEVTKSELEWKPGESGTGMNVEIEGPGRDVRTSAANAQVNPAGVANHSDIPITLLKLKVDEIKMTSSTCSPTM
jgi:opacity protein-like surface antigen